MKLEHVIEQALLIRNVELKFLELFTKSEISGTVHTSVGQELSAIAFAGQLLESDFVISNHRCHGHFIAFTNQVRGLMAELMGKKTGVCGGIGGSQHLKYKNFFSNGIQGGMLPFSAGLGQALSYQNNQENIIVTFIGDGTMGEGILYESLNIISLLKLPILIVCENNFYAQSTPIKNNLSGDLLARPKAFGIETRYSNTFDSLEIISEAKESIKFVRDKRMPLFHVVDTYRLKAHSKGDDDRNPEEVKKYEKLDFISGYKKNNKESFNSLNKKILRKINDLVSRIRLEDELKLKEYYIDPMVEDYNVTSKKNKSLPIKLSSERQVKIINKYFHNAMGSNDKIIMIGEDIDDPYGGAFKVTKGLADKYQNRVFSSPISEASIIGMGIGLAVEGYKPFVEIMFGDFLTLGVDQILNHAIKLNSMYNNQITCPIVIRTPMGGGRGYGPTHSQSIETLFAGFYSLKIITLNIFLDPIETYKNIENDKTPILLIENKLDYGKTIAYNKPEGYNAISFDYEYSPIILEPISIPPNLTIITYGGISNEVIKSIPKLFIECEIIPEIIIITQISPLRFGDFRTSVDKTQSVLVIEEGIPNFSFSSEIAAMLCEFYEEKIPFYRMGSLPVSIPTQKDLEKKVLVSSEKIIQFCMDRFG